MDVHYVGGYSMSNMLYLLEGEPAVHDDWIMNVHYAIPL